MTYVQKKFIYKERFEFVRSTNCCIEFECSLYPSIVGLSRIMFLVLLKNFLRFFSRCLFKIIPGIISLAPLRNWPFSLATPKLMIASKVKNK